MIKKILIGIILLLLIGCAAKQPAEAPNVDEVTAVDPVDTDEIIETSPIICAPFDCNQSILFSL